jgi:hypothetical protein
MLPDTPFLVSHATLTTSDSSRRCVSPGEIDCDGNGATRAARASTCDSASKTRSLPDAAIGTSSLLTKSGTKAATSRRATPTACSNDDTSALAQHLKTGTNKSRSTE